VNCAETHVSKHVRKHVCKHVSKHVSKHVGKHVQTSWHSSTPSSGLRRSRTGFTTTPPVSTFKNVDFTVKKRTLDFRYFLRFSHAKMDELAVKFGDAC
jgi:hypothetical protein